MDFGHQRCGRYWGILLEYIGFGLAAKSKPCGPINKRGGYFDSERYGSERGDEREANELLWSLNLAVIAMKELLLNVVFYVAGVALLVHLAICWLLQRSLTSNPDALQELFASPNQVLGKSRFQLLRVRYYVPWRAASSILPSMDVPQRLMLTLARISGILVPLCFLIFFALSASQALE
jgi:hypothetical protein